MKIVRQLPDATVSSGELQEQEGVRLNAVPPELNHLPAYQECYLGELAIGRLKRSNSTCMGFESLWGLL